MMQTSHWILLAVIACVGAVFWPRGSVGDDAESFTGKVRHIVDGDTLYVNGIDPAIRIWGIDAPERNEDGFQGSTDALARLAYGKQIQCIRKDTDRYGRIVAQCQLKDGRDLGAEMIKGGFAEEYCRYSKGAYGTCR